jgi:PleD family two-component response regulator
MKLSLVRLRIAKKKGKNMICWQGESVEAEMSADSVLVVDSDETNLELLKNFIGEEGIRVNIARDGTEAYEMVLAHKPKVVVSELILSKLDGFVLREQLLQNSETKDVETIFLSYKKDEDSVERALDLGVTYYLKKPYILSELVGIVKHKVKGTVKK